MHGGEGWGGGGIKLVAVGEGIGERRRTATTVGGGVFVR